MNPFQPAICIIVFNVPFTYDYIFVFIVHLKLINTYSLFLKMIISCYFNDLFLSFILCK